MLWRSSASQFFHLRVFARPRVTQALSCLTVPKSPQADKVRHVQSKGLRQHSEQHSVLGQSGPDVRHHARHSMVPACATGNLPVG